MCWYEIVKVLIRPFGHPEWQGEERNSFLTCIGMKIGFCTPCRINFPNIFLSSVGQPFTTSLFFVYSLKPLFEWCMCHLTERGLNGFLQRSGAAFQPDVQHRTNGNGTAFFPLIVGAESATAIRFRVLIRFSLSSSASLYAAGWTFHDCLHTVEGWGIGKIHFVSSFS